jgi:tetratricopeptide (TPR) repeat protein
MESNIKANTWYDILDDKNTEPLYKYVVDTNGDTWVIVYIYMQNTDYYVVMMYPESDVVGMKDDIFTSVSTTTLNGTIILPIISGIIIIATLCVLNTIGKRYTEPIRQLLNDVKQIGTADLDIELGNRAPISAEFTALQHNFTNLLTAVKFGNDAYYGGNMQKALESYENAEKLMSTLGVIRGLSVCYNNKANVYKQMGKFQEAEEFYLKSIVLVRKLIAECSDNSTILAYKVSLSYKLMNLGVLYKDTKQIQKALTHFNESVSLARETDNALGISKISGNLAQLYLDVYGDDKHKIKEARDLIYGAYETIRDKGDEISLQYALMNMGIYEKNINKNYEVALSWFTNVLHDYETVDIYVKQVCLQNVHEILQLLGRNTEAIQISQQIATSTNDVLFVLDCSGSMAGQFINTCKSSIKDIMVNYLQDSDNISMMVFNSNVTSIFANETKQNLNNLYTKIDNIKADGGTAFYDALYHAVLNMDKAGDATKWIVALTDGDDQHSKKKPEEVIKLIKQKSINIVIMTVGKLGNAETIKRICNSVRNGGKGIFIEIDKNPEGISKAFKKVAKLIVGQLNVESL